MNDYAVLSVPPERLTLITDPATQPTFPLIHRDHWENYGD